MLLQLFQKFDHVVKTILTLCFLRRTMEAEFYNIKTKLYLGLFSVKTLFMTSFALDATLRSSLGLLHGRKRAHCDVVHAFLRKNHFRKHIHT